MTTENEDLVLRLWDRIWITGELDELEQIVADPYIRHTRDGTVTSSPGEYRTHIASVARMIRGTELTIDDMVSQDDLVFARLRLDGVNLDTGGSVHLTWLTQYRIDGGRIAEAWTMHQSGLDW